MNIASEVAPWRAKICARSKPTSPRLPVRSRHSTSRAPSRSPHHLRYTQASRHRSVGGLARATHGSTGGGAGREGKEGKVGRAFCSARLSRQLKYLAELLNLSDTRPEQGGYDERPYPYSAPVTCCIRRD